MKTKAIRNKLKAKKKPPIKRSDFVSTGSTLLNLACTGWPECGFAKGKYYFIVGDSISGKTFLSLTCLAEASVNKHFDNYRFIYDNAEGGALMDIKRFFGKAVFERMEPPSWERDRCWEEDNPEDFTTIEPSYSSTIEEFYYHVDDAIRKGKPFIYILDSMDSLTSKPEAVKFDQHKKAHKKGKQAPGSYGDGKAKINAGNLRRLLKPLDTMGSILIIINQTRDNIKKFSFEKKTRSGGHALRFYATIELWSSVESIIKRTIRDKKRQTGIWCKIQIKKNRITGKERTIVLPIYHSFGIADVDSCVDFLVKEGHWKKQGGKVIAPELDFKGMTEKLVRYIEAEGFEKDVRDMVVTVWNEIEKACAVKRKRRYD